MTSSQQQQLVDDENIEASVIEYLSRNPHFFAEQPELLAQMQIPHASGTAISLLEHQVRVLRLRNHALQNRLDELLEVARDNDRLAERMHRLTLELMDADNLDGVLFGLQDELRSNFDCDAVTIKLFGKGESGQGWVELSLAEQKIFADVLKEPKPACGRLPQEQLQFLFGDTAAAIRSAALVPLADPEPVGFLAMGSFRTDRFHPGMGTIFLRQLGASAGRAVQRYL